MTDEIKNPELEERELEAKDEVEVLADRMKETEEPPINPVGRMPVNRQEKAYLFYTENKVNFQDWWDEFNTTLDEDGGLKYKTIIQFAKSKYKTKIERELMLEMLGPMPVLKPGRKLRVPWLGDWARRRTNGFLAPKQSMSIQALGKSIREKIVHWDAVREGIPYLITDLARLESMSQQIDQLFSGMVMDPNLPPTSPKNSSRFSAYFGLFAQISEWKLKFWEAFLTANGVNPKDPAYQTQINQITQNFTNPAGVMDNSYLEMSDDPRQALEMMKCAKMLTMHAKTYNLPLPEKLLPKDQVQEQQEEKKPNGEQKGRLQ